MSWPCRLLPGSLTKRPAGVVRSCGRICDSGRWPMPGAEWSPRAEPSSTGALPAWPPPGPNTWMVAAGLSITAKGMPWWSAVADTQCTSRCASTVAPERAHGSAAARAEGDQTAAGRQDAAPAASMARRCRACGVRPVETAKNSRTGEGMSGGKLMVPPNRSGLCQ